MKTTKQLLSALLFATCMIGFASNQSTDSTYPQAINPIHDEMTK